MGNTGSQGRGDSSSDSDRSDRGGSDTLAGVRHGNMQRTSFRGADESHADDAVELLDIHHDHRSDGYGGGAASPVTATTPPHPPPPLQQQHLGSQQQPTRRVRARRSLGAITPGMGGRREAYEQPIPYTAARSRRHAPSGGSYATPRPPGEAAPTPASAPTPIDSSSGSDGGGHGGHARHSHGGRRGIAELRELLRCRGEEAARTAKHARALLGQVHVLRTVNAAVAHENDMLLELNKLRRKRLGPELAELLLYAP